MEFSEIIVEFTSRKLIQYAEKEIAENNRVMDQKLAAYCQNELLKNVFPWMQRIMAYEYNKLQDEDVINASLPADELYAAFRNVILSEEYIRRFDEKFYVFPKIMGKQLQNLAVYQREIYENYKEDRDKMIATFSEDFDDILAIDCSQGDLHNGKSVAFITFANGKKLVYKPRNEDNSLLLEAVVNFLSQGGSIRDFRYINHYSVSNHSWEQVAQYHHCNSYEEIERYYYRAGVLLAAFYFLGSFDMHHENVICDGEYPVIIDCETISKSFVSSPNLEKNRNEFVDSVLNTCFIPYISENDPYGVALSGLFSWTGSAKGTTNQMVIDQGEIKFREAHAYVGEEKNIVALEDGTTIAVESAKRILVSSFRDACRFAIDHKEGLMELIKEFCSMHDLEFRQLLRGTQAYAQFVYVGYHPDLLQDEDKRDDMFMILSKNFVPGNFGYIRVQHEISELKKGQIPLYYTRPDSRHLFSDGDVVCENYYSESPLEVMRARIMAFDTDRLDFQVSLIQKSVALTALETSVSSTQVKNAPSVGEMTKDYLEKNIKYIVDSIIKDAFETGENSSSLVTLGFHMQDNNGRIFLMKNLASSLYENGALPLLLAYWAKKTDDPAALDCAKRFMENNYLQFGQIIESSKIAKKERFDKQNMSVFSGHGGILYLSYNMYALLNDRYYWDKYLEEAKYILEWYNKKEKLAAEDYDYVNGFIAAVYVIAKIYQRNPTASEPLRELICSAIQKSVTDFQLSEHMAVGFAHGLSGLMIIFTEFYKLTNDSKILGIIEQFIETEDDLIAKGEWKQSTVYTWCNGRSGVLLCRGLLKKAMLPSEKINSAVERYDEWLNDKDMFNIHNFCLCHGVFGNVEIAKALLGPEFDINGCIPNKLFEAFSDLRWIDGLDYEFEGFMCGNTGIAYAMLELLEAAPPILTLDLWSNQ